MSVLTFLTRRPRHTGSLPDQPTTHQNPPADKPDRDVLMRFLTHGGAEVELRPAGYISRWAASGPPHAADPHRVEGFNWRCQGCRSYGREGDTYNDPGYLERREAREEANSHAANCWAMPDPQTAG